MKNIYNNNKLVDMNNNMNIVKKIKLIIIENNGCLSNPVSTINHKGDIVQTFNMLDILAIQDVPKNYQICIISNNSIHIHNLHQLKTKENNNIFFASNIDDKFVWIEKYIDKHNISFSEVAYIGFSTDDISLLEKCGLTACPNNAHYKIKDLSKFISEYNGGDGAIYEFLDLFNYNGKENIKNKLNKKNQEKNEECNSILSVSMSELLSEIERERSLRMQLEHILTNIYQNNPINIPQVDLTNIQQQPQGNRNNKWFGIRNPFMSS
jgi:YrbI family 3-deoxy-D-manno-octulosonate 8-phosphate phosphatase